MNSLKVMLTTVILAFSLISVTFAEANPDIGELLRFLERIDRECKNLERDIRDNEQTAQLVATVDEISELMKEASVVLSRGVLYYYYSKDFAEIRKTLKSVKFKLLQKENEGVKDQITKVKKTVGSIIDELMSR